MITHFVEYVNTKFHKMRIFFLTLWRTRTIIKLLEVILMYGNLRIFRESLGMTQKEFAASLSIGLTTYNGYETGARDPKSDFWVAVATKYQVTVDYLMGFSNDPHKTSDKIKNAPLYSSEALKLASDYDNRMDDRGRETVRAVADFEIARKKMQEHRDEQPALDNIIYITQWYPYPMSAGTGQLASNEIPEELELTKRPPRGTSYVAPVSGDSMEPTYHDGDKLFVRACEEIEVGQIGVFLMDGQQWVKELGDGVLISHNDKYDPIPMREDIRCQGLVLGVCDESYFEK